MLIYTQRIVKNKYSLTPLPKKNPNEETMEIIILTESPSFSGTYYMNLNTE